MYIDDMKKKRKSPAVALAKFLIFSSVRSNKPIWVFEGDDDIDYYSARIEMYFGLPGNIFVADGKNGALKIRNYLKFNENFTDVMAAFFIDKDFDEVNESDSVTYVTPGYSFENFYITDGAIKRMLFEKFRLHDDDDADELERIIALIKKWRYDFCNHILPYCCVMVLCKEINFDSKSIIDDIKENMIGFGKKKNSFISVKKLPDGVDFKIDVGFSDVLKKHGFDGFIGEDRVAVVCESKKIIYDKNLHMFVRGKYIVPFLATIISVLIEDSNKKETPSIFSKKRKCSEQINDGSVVSALSKYAETPDCLSKFLYSLSLKWDYSVINRC